MEVRSDASAMTYTPIGKIQQHGIDDSGQHRFSQVVEFNNKKYRVTVHTSEVLTQSQLKTKIESSIQKIAPLAVELKVGKGGLQSLQLSAEGVKGHYVSGGGPQDMQQKLQENLQNLEDDLRENPAHHDAPKMQKEIAKLTRQLDAVTKANDCYAHHSSERVSSPRLSSPSSPVETSSSISEASVEGAAFHHLDPVEQPELMAFNSIFADAKLAAATMEDSEKRKLEELLSQCQDAYRGLENLSNDEGLSAPERAQLLKELRNEMVGLSEEQRKMTTKSQEEQFQALEDGLSEMCAIFNGVAKERKALEQDKSGDHSQRLEELMHLESEMRAKIRECHAELGQTSVTINAFTATKSHVINFAAVLEKRLSLMEQQVELQENPTKGSKKKLHKINKDLAKAPPLAMMNKSAEEIGNELKKPSLDLVSIPEAKKLNRAHPELEWGASHLNFALTTPANWTTVRSALIKESRDGRMYVSVSKNEPRNIEENGGGVPAGLRSHKDFQERAANLMKTTSYLRTGNGSETIGKQISFRGGQFPTTKAAKEALVAMMSEQPLEELHVNALLTPIALTKIKEDKLLLIAHKNNIEAAITEMIKETKDPGQKDSLEKLQRQLAISNFGVNEGAVGEMKMMGMRVGAAKFGWHTSIGEYSNQAAQQLNKSLARKFDDTKSPAFLDRLGAIVQVGQEMEEVWAKNDYANAQVGNNQFKLPALWKTMDALIGVTCYTDCMSGKDRTGKVESNAQEYLDEIHMSIHDQKLMLNEDFDALKSKLTTPEQQEAWESNREVLTAACFQPDELKSLHNILMQVGKTNEFRGLVEHMVERKVASAKFCLGMGKGGGLMEEKNDIPQDFFTTGVTGISTNQPKRETHPIGELFPRVAVGSMYTNGAVDFKAYNFTRLALLDQHGDLNETQMLDLENRGKLSSLLAGRQREAVNRRLSQLTGSLQITQINTSKPGFKVEGGEPLARFSSGFDRDYVLFQLLTAKKDDPDFASSFNNWVGLYELDKKSAQDYTQQVLQIVNNTSLTQDQKIAKWTTVLAKIEEHKMETLAPKAKVKA